MENLEEKYMKAAIELAKQAETYGEIPVGAVVVLDNKIIGKGFNKRESKLDISSHAEIEALKDAEKNIGNWRLDGATIYVTLEPCLMCAGAILQSRVSKVVFGSYDEKDGAIVSHYFVYDTPSIHERPLVYGGILKDECDSLLKNFFASKRK
ncbi:MAG: tRNA adenosine(34) deaminase TadA [Bacilli bacterium]|nr:tRNA adenosine(34) deaminase TadA [Bacilli bacterium]